MNGSSKPLVWLHGEIQTPPFTAEGRHEAGLLRRLQERESLSMPHSRPMPSIGPRCHELRVRDAGHNWRIDESEIIIADVFAKQSQATPRTVIDACQRRSRNYDLADD